MSYVFSFFNSIQKDEKIINLEPHVHTIKQVCLDKRRLDPRNKAYEAFPESWETPCIFNRRTKGRHLHL